MSDANEEGEPVIVPKRIAWIASSTDFSLASIRYRLIYPAVMLQKLGWENIVTASPDSLLGKLPELDAIIIVKRLDPSIIRIVCEANDAGVPVLLDLCDDVLDADYRVSGHEMFRAVFDAVAPRLSGLVTTGSYLKHRFEQYGFRGPIFVVPDCIETAALSALGQNFIKKHTAQNTVAAIAAPHAAVRRIKAGRDFIRRLYDAVRHPRRSALDPRRTLRTILRGDASENALNAEAAKTDPYFLEALNDKRRSLIWFGNHGGPHSDFGMATLLRVGAELRQAHARSPFVLFVVSNDQEKWKHLIEPMGIPTRFVPWSHEGTQALLKRSRAFIMPTGQDSFSLGKSANRVTLALEQNTPVIAESLDSLDWMHKGVQRQGLADAIVACLEDRAAALATAVELRAAAQQHFAINVIAKQWQDVVLAARPYRSRRGQYGDLKLPEKLLVLVNNATDRPIAMAIIDAAARHRIDTGVIVSQEACFRNPQLIEDLIARRIAPTFIQRKDARRTDYRWLRNASALFCPSESSLPAHAIPHWLTKLANQAGVRTFTAQHGLVNVGLTDSSAPDVRMASGTVFTWNDPARLPDWVAPDLRARCTPTGRITDPRVWTLRHARTPGAAPNRIGIFENLHWQAYPDSFRDLFRSMVISLAERHPETEFMLLPHPAGLWSVKFIKSTSLPTNLSIINPASRENLGRTGLAALASIDRVLTTPSSIAVDAVQVGLPTVIVAPQGFDVSNYRGLRAVHEVEEASSALFEAWSDEMMDGAKAFLASSMLDSDDAAERALRIMFPISRATEDKSKTPLLRIHSGESM